MKVALVPATWLDASMVAANMRQEDIDELRDLSGSTPAAAILSCMESAGEVYAARWRGQPIALLGCAPVHVLGNVGSPWLLGTRGVDRVGMAVVREARKLCDQWARRYALLENMADGRNAKTLRWLAAVGFELDPPVEVKPGVFGVRFVMKGRENV